AGRRLAELAAWYNLAFFDDWVPDYMGHRGTLAEAQAVFERLDVVLGALLSAWDDANGLIVITADHGNVEDMSQSHHTANLVPTLTIGQAAPAFADGLTALTGFASRIESYLTDSL